MNLTGGDRACRACDSVSRKGFGVVGLGLLMLGGALSAGCGIGTDPSLLAASDGAAAQGSPDASDSSALLGSIPPIDQLTYEETAMATFALG